MTNNKQVELIEQAVELIKLEKLPHDVLEQFNKIYQSADEVGKICLDDLKTTLSAKMIEQRFEGDSTAEEIEEAATQTATSVDNDLPEPSEANKVAGNYKKGKFTWSGLVVAIENPKDSARTGVSPDGESWATTMTAHYGYIAKTEGADGDQVDVFIGQDMASESVYIIDQVDPKTKAFDEHKCMLMCSDLESAKALYLSNYEEGWDGIGAITEMSIDGFKEWLKGDTSKPISEEVILASVQDEPHQTKDLYLHESNGEFSIHPKSRSEKIASDSFEVSGMEKEKAVDVMNSLQEKIDSEGRDGILVNWKDEAVLASVQEGEPENENEPAEPDNEPTE